MKELSIEDKELLFKDLCVRYPYDLIVRVLDFNDPTYQKDGNLHNIKYFGGDYNGMPYLFDVDNQPCLCDITEIKPYLRSMSSMTEEEKKKYQALQIPVCSYHYEFGDIVDDILYFDTDVSFDYLNSIHIDYRGLIEKGLAIEAPEGMYDYVE